MQSTNLLIALVKVGAFAPMGYEDEKGLFTSWEAVTIAAKALIIQDSRIKACVMRDLDGQTKTLTKEEATA